MITLTTQAEQVLRRLAGHPFGNYPIDIQPELNQAPRLTGLVNDKAQMHDHSGRVYYLGTTKRIVVGDVWLRETFKQQYITARLLNEPMHLTDRDGLEIQVRERRSRLGAWRNAEAAAEMIVKQHEHPEEDHEGYAD